MIAFAINGSGYEKLIIIAILIGIVVPLILYIVGIVQLGKNKKRGKIILLVATVYALISFGICGGFTF